MKMIRLLGLVFWLATVGLGGSAALAQAAERPPILVGHINGIIGPPMASYVRRILVQAQQESAEAVVFYMDTPGGLSDSMRAINAAILSSDVPVIVYVAPNGARAGSAGVYISYAAQLLVMAPTTNIGSATPVSLGQNGAESAMSPEMQAKVTNDAVAQIRALAEQRGRNADFAERAVREGANLPASEALRQNVSNYGAVDLPDLLRQVDGVTVQVASGSKILHTAGGRQQPADMSLFERFLLTVTEPSIAYLLLSTGSLALLVELYNPGSVLPGIIGVTFVLLALYALGTLPVNFAGLALIAFGLFLFALEPFLTSHGLLAIGGAASFAAGSILLIDAPESAAFLRVPVLLVAAVTLGLLALAGILLVAVLQARRRRPVTGREAMLGEQGIARTPFGPAEAGLVLVRGELWKAVCPYESVTPSEAVQVERLEGLLLTVRKVPAPALLPPPAPPQASAEPYGPAAIAGRAG